jgi:hypothetical protein
MALIMFAVSGCTMVHDYVAKLDEGSASAYCEQQRNNPAARVLAGKLPIVSVDEITPEMLANDAVPSENEVEAIRMLSHDQRDCRARKDAVAKDHWPTQTATRRELALKLDLVTVELLKRKISFGNANRLYQEAALDAEGKLTLDRKDELEKSRQQEANAWKTIGEGIRAIAGTQKPEQTEDPCTWAGNRINCNGN